MFKGIKDGGLKASKRKLISEKIDEFHDLKAMNFKLSLKLEGKKKIVENLVFVYSENVYTIQFMNAKNEFENNTEFRKKIIKSIKLK